jgi:hypothetical protein
LTADVLAVAVQPGCSVNGRSSELAEGLDWILDQIEKHPGQPAIVSMSLLISFESEAAQLVADKVADLLDAGAIVVASSGNKSSGVYPCFVILCC